MTVENVILISVLINRFDVAMRSFKHLCHLENRLGSIPLRSDEAVNKLAYMKSLLLRGLVQANMLHEAHALVDYLSRHTLAMDDISPSSIATAQITAPIANAAHTRILQNHSVVLLESPCSQSSRLKRESLLQAKQRFDVVLDNIVDRATLSTPISTRVREDDDGGFRQSWKVHNSETTIAPIPLQSKSSMSDNSQATAMDNLQHASAKSMKLLINVSKAEPNLHRNDQPDDDITRKYGFRYENVTSHGSDGKQNPNAYLSRANMPPKERLLPGSHGFQQVNVLLRAHGATINPSPACDATSPATMSTLSQSNFGTPTAKPSVSLKEEVNRTTSGISDAMEWLTFRHGRRSPSPRCSDRRALPNGAQTKRVSTLISPPNTPTVKREELPANSFGTCAVASEDSQSIDGDGLLSTSRETFKTFSSMDVSAVNHNSPPQLPPPYSPPTRSHLKIHNSKVATNDVQDLQSPIISEAPAPLIVDCKDSEEDTHWRMDGYEDSPLQPSLRKGSSWTTAKSMVYVANESRSRVKTGRRTDGHIEYLFLKHSDCASNGRKNLLSGRTKAPTLSMSAPNTPAIRKRQDELELCTSVGELCTSTDINCDLRCVSDTETAEALSISTARCSSAERSFNACKNCNVHGTMMGYHDVDKERRLVEHQATISTNKNSYKQNSICSSLSLAKTDYKPSSPLEPTGFGRSWLSSSLSDASRKQLPENWLHSRRPLCDESSHSVPPRLGKTLPGTRTDRFLPSQFNASDQPAAGVAETSVPTSTFSSNTYRSEYLDYDVVHRHVRENFFGGPLSQEDVDPDVTMGSFDILVDVTRASPKSELGRSGEGNSSWVPCQPNTAATERVSAPRIPLSGTSPRFFKYEQLAFPGPYPAGIQLSRRELYLSEADFKRILGVSKEQWGSLPKWRRILKKREKKLF